MDTSINGSKYFEMSEESYTCPAQIPLLRGRFRKLVESSPTEEGNWLIFNHPGHFLVYSKLTYFCIFDAAYTVFQGPNSELSNEDTVAAVVTEIRINQNKTQRPKYISDDFDLLASLLRGEQRLNEKVIDVALALLKVLAERKLKITYSELSAKTAYHPDPHLELPKLLDEVNRICAKLKLPCISSLVVNKDTGMPGGGFKKICIEEFGYEEQLSKEEIYEKELLSIGKCSEWNKLAIKLGLEMPEVDEDPLPEEIGELNVPLKEGAKKEIVVNAYERDPKAVKCCKDYYMHRDGKIVCQICRFDFGAFYGVEYANKIHIHHIKPISEIGEEYVVDPVKDLIPVCPNCHMVLHANGGITVKELRKKLGTV